MEDQPTTGIAREHAVEREQVEVNVEVQTSEALNEIYRAALRVLDPVAPGARAVPGEDRLDEDARERAVSTSALNAASLRSS
jgi:hypothetical protein